MNEALAKVVLSIRSNLLQIWLTSSFLKKLLHFKSKRDSVALSCLFFLFCLCGQIKADELGFQDFLLAPVRVHLLSAKSSPRIQTTLTENDITRILGKVNTVWSKAGLHFYLETLVAEEANQPDINENSAMEGSPSGLLGLRPNMSLATNLFHIYYIKEMRMNGIYFPEGIFVKDTASLKKVAGGLDEPLPRVTSHELGHAFSLNHRQDTTNLMASGTTGTSLNSEEIQLARATALKIDWLVRAPALLESANKLFSADPMKALPLYSILARIPIGDQQVELAKRRITEAQLGQPRQPANGE